MSTPATSPRASSIQTLATDQQSPTTPRIPSVSLQYDIRSLDYVFATDPNLSCPICHSPLVDPVQTRCLHTFCSECISLHLDRSSNCPVDRKSLDMQDVSAAPIMITNLVNDLVVVCPNADKGCTATCPRYLLNGHLKHKCEQIMVHCSEEGCDELIMKKDLGECLHKEVQCSDCLTRVRKLDLEQHKAICPNLTSECEHCLNDFSRSDIQSHTAICPDAIIPCTASSYGCTYSTTRITLPEHTMTCSFVHLSPLLQLHTDRINKLELENRYIRKKLDQYSRQHHALNQPEPEVDDHTYHLYAEQEHLRADLDRLAANLGELEVKQAMLLMNENLRYNEEMAGMRAAINGLRMQIHWLATRGIASAGAGASSNTNNNTIEDTRRSSVVKL